jgi:hypothetical protein
MDDYMRPDADDLLPRDDGVAVHPRLGRPTAPVGSDAIALEDALACRRQSRSPAGVLPRALGSGSEPSEEAARAQRVVTGEDLHHLRRVAVETGDLKIIDLTAVLPVAVNELVIEDADNLVDIGDLSHASRRPTMPKG